MLDLSRKTELRWLGALIADVRAAAPRATFLIAGATARDLILKYGHGIDTGRATERASAWLMGRDSFKVASASEAPKATQDYFRRLIETEVTAGVDALLLGDMRSAAPGKDLVLIRSFHEGFA